MSTSMPAMKGSTQNVTRPGGKRNKNKPHNVAWTRERVGLVRERPVLAPVPRAAAQSKDTMEELLKSGDGGRHLQEQLKLSAPASAYEILDFKPDWGGETSIVYAKIGDSLSQVVMERDSLRGEVAQLRKDMLAMGDEMKQAKEEKEAKELLFQRNEQYVRALQGINLLFWERAVAQPALLNELRGKGIQGPLDLHFYLWRYATDRNWLQRVEQLGQKPEYLRLARKLVDARKKIASDRNLAVHPSSPASVLPGLADELSCTPKERTLLMQVGMLSFFDA